jgi:predicted nucleic acid-binding protein
VLEAGEPAGLFLLDTNILVYTFDSSAPIKRDRARSLVQSALKTRMGRISTQVVQEFLNVATRKLSVPMKSRDAEDYLRQVLTPLCRHNPDPDFYQRALALASSASLSWYDSLIVQAGLDLGCVVLYSEDLQHGRAFGNLRVENPFRD